MAKGAHSRVFFPWERRRGVAGWLGRVRGRLSIALLLALVLVVAVIRRERAAAAVRATRASIGDVTRAVSAYRAANGGRCPKALDELSRGGHIRDLPVDAWQRPFRLLCPGRKDPAGFEVVSDGPDGEPFGLDRVE